MKSSCWRPAAWLCVVLVAACADEGTRPGERAAAQPFDLSGRLAVRDREHGFSGALRWESRRDGDALWLSTPLGQSFAQLRAGADSATLTTADGTQYRAASIESLTQSAWGWRFPVAPLRYWVRGMPAPGPAAEHAERDAAGRLTQLSQAGWQVVFDYTSTTTAVPARIDVTGSDAAIRLVIDRFEPLAP